MPEAREESGIQVYEPPVAEEVKTPMVSRLSGLPLRRVMVAGLFKSPVYLITVACPTAAEEGTLVKARVF